MRTITLCLLGGCLLAACNNEPKAETAPAVAASKTSEALPPPAPAAVPRPDSATMERNWREYMTPGTEHLMLADAAGSWDCETTFWAAPGAPGVTSMLQTQTKMILGKLYQQSVSKGKVYGMDFEGISTVAFDKHKKKYLSTWIDNMGSGIVSLEGSWDSTTRTINFTGTMVNPGTGQEEAARETWTVIDRDHQLMQMYGPGPDGKEFKVMQIHYRRKK